MLRCFYTNHCQYIIDGLARCAAQNQTCVTHFVLCFLDAARIVEAMELRTQGNGVLVQAARVLCTA